MPYWSCRPGSLRGQATYARYVQDDAYFGSTTGLSSKQERVAAQRSGDKPPAFKVSDEKYRMFGDTATTRTVQMGLTLRRKSRPRYIEV